MNYSNSINLGIGFPRSVINLEQRKKMIRKDSNYFRYFSLRKLARMDSKKLKILKNKTKKLKKRRWLLDST